MQFVIKWYYFFLNKLMLVYNSKNFFHIFFWIYLETRSLDDKEIFIQPPLFLIIAHLSGRDDVFTCICLSFWLSFVSLSMTKISQEHAELFKIQFTAKVLHSREGTDSFCLDPIQDCWLIATGDQNPLLAKTWYRIKILTLNLVRQPNFQQIQSSGNICYYFIEKGIELPF